MPQDDVMFERDDETSTESSEGLASHAFSVGEGPASSVGEGPASHAFDSYLRLVEHHDDRGFTDRVMTALPPSRARMRQGILMGACGAGVVTALVWPTTRELVGTFVMTMREADPVSFSWGAVGVAACATLVAVWAAATA